MDVDLNLNRHRQPINAGRCAIGFHQSKANTHRLLYYYCLVALLFQVETTALTNSTIGVQYALLQQLASGRYYER